VNVRRTVWRRPVTILTAVVLLSVLSARAQTDRVTFNPARQGVVFNPTRQGVAHTPWKQGVVLNAPRGGRDAPDRPAVVNRIPATYDRTDDWYGAHDRTVRLPRRVRVPVLADEREPARVALPIPWPANPVVPADSLEYRLGQRWGEALLRGTVGWEEFVRYVGEHLADATPLFQAEFRRGFLAAYGTDGPAVWAQAQAEAAPRATAGPVVIFSEYGTVTGH
jgi:hypothetical protein